MLPYAASLQISYTFSSNTPQIRGQINDSFDKVAYLSGTNVVPPITTSSTGLMLMREIDFSTYEYRLFYVR